MGMAVTVNEVTVSTHTQVECMMISMHASSDLAIHMADRMALILEVALEFPLLVVFSVAYS